MDFLKEVAVRWHGEWVKAVSGWAKDSGRMNVPIGLTHCELAALRAQNDCKLLYGGVQLVWSVGGESHKKASPGMIRRVQRR